MEFIDVTLLNYCENHSTEETNVLKALVRETHLKNLSPRMLSGHLQGHFLTQIIQISKAKNILEIGTFTGYSAICMAMGLPKDGKLISIDYNEEIESIARKYFHLAGLDEQIELHIGDAREIIPQLNQTFDFVFIDADKRSYSIYYDLVIEKMDSGGIILADNVLWSGKVLDENAKDADTMAIKAFNQKVYEDKRVTCTLLPIRDGLMMIRKI
jgi:caffeoyl-CoA O-methyltransferase